MQEVKNFLVEVGINRIDILDTNYLESNFLLLEEGFKMAVNIRI